MASHVEQMEAIFPFTTIPNRPIENTAGEWGNKVDSSELHRQLADLPFLTEDIIFFSPGDRIHVLERPAGHQWWLGAIRMSKTALTESELRNLKFQSAAAAESACSNSSALASSNDLKSKTGLSSRLAKHASQKWIDEATELASVRLEILKSAETQPLLLPVEAIEPKAAVLLDAGTSPNSSPASPVRMLQSNELPGNFDLDRPYSMVDDGKLFLFSTYGGGEEIYKIGYFYAPYCRVIKTEAKPVERTKSLSFALAGSRDEEDGVSRQHKDPTQLFADQEHEERLKRMLGFDVSTDEGDTEQLATLGQKRASTLSKFRGLLQGGGRMKIDGNINDKDDDAVEGKAQQLKRLQDSLFSGQSSFARAMQNQPSSEVSLETMRDELLKLTIQLRRTIHRNTRDYTLLEAEEAVLVKRFLRSISQLDLHRDSSLRSLVTKLAKGWSDSTLESVEDQLKNLGLMGLLKKKKHTEGGESDDGESVAPDDLEEELVNIHRQANAMKGELRFLGARLDHVKARNEVLECHADEAPEAAPEYNCLTFFAKEDSAREAAAALTSTSSSGPNAIESQVGDSKDSVPVVDAPLEPPSMEVFAQDPIAKKLLKKMGKRYMECEYTKEDYLAQKAKIDKGLTKAAEAFKEMSEVFAQRKRRVEKQQEILEISRSLLGHPPQYDSADKLIDSSVHPSILKQYKCLLIHEDDAETVPYIEDCESALEKITGKTIALKEKLKSSLEAHQDLFKQRETLEEDLEKRKQQSDELKRTIGFVKKECNALSAAALGAKDELISVEAEKARAEEASRTAVSHWKKMKATAAAELDNMDTKIETETARIRNFEEQLAELQRRTNT